MRNKNRDTMHWWVLPMAVLTAVLTSVVMGACSSIECPVQNTIATIYELNDTLKDTLTVWTKRKDGKDTVLLNKQINATQLTLPISQQRDVDTLIFGTTRLAVTDTVWLMKMDLPHFESVDCGTAFFHLLTGVKSTHSGIDSVVIIKPYIDYDLSYAHLRIYFKARD